MIFVDFETRSPVDLKKHGGRRYAADPRTEILCGVALDCRTDPATVYAWTPFAGPLGDWSVPASYLEQINTPADAIRYAPAQCGGTGLAVRPSQVLSAAEVRVPLVAHNADGFDRHVWDRVYGSPALWIDSLPLARRRGLPGGLDQIGKELYGIGKDKQGYRTMLAYCQPRSCAACGKRWTRCRCDTPDPRYLDPDKGALTAIVRYCLRDVLLLAAAWHDEWLGEPHPDDNVLDVHRVIDERGVLVDVEGVKTLQRIDAEALDEAARRAEGCGVDLTTLRSPTALTRWLHDKGFAAQDVTAPTVRGLLERDDLPDTVRRVLEARLAVARVTGGKAQALLDRVSSDNRIRGILAYYGAHTGRWAGRGFQPQNLPRPAKGTEDIWDSPEDAPAVATQIGASLADVLGSMLRGVLIAPPGKLLAIVDYSSIEARALLWLAGDEKGLEVYRQGGDAYRHAAAGIYGVRADRVTKDQRQVGKVAVLALGYQGGPGAFSAMATSYGLDTSALDLPKIVEAWRDGHVAVAGAGVGWWDTPAREDQPSRRVRVRRGGLWRLTKAAAWAAVQSGATAVVGRTHWIRDGDGHLRAVLPSGRSLLYRDPRVEPWESRWGEIKPTLTYWGQIPGTSKFGRIPTYGGKLVENVTQAVCRDLLAHALVNLERAGLRPVLTVHDEVVCEVDHADQLADVERIMCDAPEWAAGLPVAAEGHVSERYGKG